MIKDLIDVFRPKRWYRNIFMILGILIAIKILNIKTEEIFNFTQIFTIVVAFCATCLITSANYGINEILDAKSDVYHPQKKDRPIPSGRISKKIILCISIILYIVGIILILILKNWALTFSLSLLILSGILYNVPPIRLKDKAYVDFISEAVNNPLRLMIGWYTISNPNNIVPISFILGYWFLGIFLMAAKRFGEIRFIRDKIEAQKYRRGFANYSEEHLLMSMIAALVALSYMLGVLSLKYSVDIVLALPFLIIWILWFLKIAYEENTVVKDPERIFEKIPFLIFTIVITFIFIYLFYSGDQIFGWLK